MLQSLLLQPRSQVLSSTRRSVGTSRREPWERAWAFSSASPDLWNELPQNTRCYGCPNQLITLFKKLFIYDHPMNISPTCSFYLIFIWFYSFHQYCKILTHSVTLQFLNSAFLIIYFINPNQPGWVLTVFFRLQCLTLIHRVQCLTIAWMLNPNNSSAVLEGNANLLPVSHGWKVMLIKAGKFGQALWGHPLIYWLSKSFFSIF